MTTTIDLSEQEISELKEFTEQEDAAAAARSAIREYLRYVKRMRLISLSNEVEMEDNWQEFEQPCRVRYADRGRDARRRSSINRQNLEK